MLTMSYLVLARKYRPRHFGEMVGQEHVVQALANALTQQRLHHAYLFTGTRGVGKTTVSRILAKSLNCTGVDGQGGVTATPCGQCPACTAIDAGRFVDYTELDAASNRGVDEVQALLEQAVYKPVQGRFKVFMIDEVHMLTNTAFNAMLKTLEEPPEYLKFVLATTDPQKVPVTVLSRCLQFNLRPMAPETIAAHLQQVLGAEQIVAEPGALHLLARAARGSMRDALSLADQAIAFGGSQGVQEAAVRQMLGCVGSSHVLGLVDALACCDAAQVMAGVQALQEQGLSADSALEDMARILQRMAVQQAVPGMAVDKADPDAAEIARLAANLPPDETQLLYSICVHGRAELGLAPDEYAGLSMVLLRLLAFKPAAEKKTLKTADDITAGAQASRTHPAQPEKALQERKAEKHTISAECAPVANRASDDNPPPWEEAPVQAVVAPTHGATAGPAVVETCLPADAVCAADAFANVSSANDLVLPVHTQPEPRPPSPSQPVSQADGALTNRLPLLVPTELGDVWNGLAQALCQQDGINGLVRELLLQGQLMEQRAPQESGSSAAWVLRVERESVNHEPSRKKLEQAVAVHAGQPVRLQIEYGRVVDCPALRTAAARAQQQRQAEETFGAHPFVQAMMQEFAARTLPGSVGYAGEPPVAPAGK